MIFFTPRKWVTLMGVFSFGVSLASTQNLGVYGQLYPIGEPNLLTFIHDRLLSLQKNGSLVQMEQQVDARVQQHVLRPTPVFGVINAEIPNTFYVTPTFTLEHTLYNAQGELLYFKGTQINPLDIKTLHAINPDFIPPVFNETLLFINADDPKQVAWALKEKKEKKENTPLKIILTKGNIKKASDQLGRIYFDQDGILCQKFKITAVPAIVTRVGVRLQIKEVPVDV